MGKIFDNNYVEVVLELFDGEECWYLLLFGVYYYKNWIRFGECLIYLLNLREFF